MNPCPWGGGILVSQRVGLYVLVLSLVRGHTAGEWQSLDFYPDLPVTNQVGFARTPEAARSPI